MRKFTLLLSSISLILAAIAIYMLMTRNNEPIQSPTETPQENTTTAHSTDITLEEPNNTMLCFGERKKEILGNGIPDGYSTTLLVFDVSPDGSVEGYMRYHPFETDSGVGSITGTFDSKNSIIKAETRLYGEGSHYTDSRIWEILPDGNLLSGYTQNQLAGEAEDFSNLSSVIWNMDFPTPSIDCKTGESWLDDFYTSWSDYSKDLETFRLQDALGETLPLTAIVREIEIDNDWNTQETLYYITDSNYCGSGGCMMVVINQDNEILLQTTVTKPPVYLSIPTEQNSDWRDVVVWSDGGFRILKHDGNSYPSNPSLMEKTPERDITWHPETYSLIVK